MLCEYLLASSWGHNRKAERAQVQQTQNKHNILTVERWTWREALGRTCKQSVYNDKTDLAVSSNHLWSMFGALSGKSWCLLATSWDNLQAAWGNGRIAKYEVIYTSPQNKSSMPQISSYRHLLRKHKLRRILRYGRHLLKPKKGPQ